MRGEKFVEGWDESQNGGLKKNLRTFEDTPFIGKVKKVEGKERRKKSKRNVKSSSDITHFNGISYWFSKNRILKAPHVITVHHLVKDAIKNNNISLISRFQDISGENNLFISFIEKMCMKFEDMVITVSDLTKNQIVKTHKVTSAKIEVIHNGIDLLVDAFSDLVNELDGFVLVIAGQDDEFLVMLKWKN